MSVATGQASLRARFAHGQDRSASIGLLAAVIVLIGCASTPSCPTTLCGAECVDTSSDIANCGACGNPCAPGFVCAGGACTLTCAAGQTACGQTGCYDLSRDRGHCGQCAISCKPGEVCAAGRCAISCPAGSINCDGVCALLGSDVAHCGDCRYACAAGFACHSGACVLACQAGLSDCGGTCTNLATDPQHCGGCGASCPPGDRCLLGVCHLSCPPGLGECSGSCVNTSVDPAHCGGCGQACSLPSATAACLNATCVVAACDPGRADCDAMPQDGCEVDLGEDAANCGGCNLVCASPNAVPACQGGACTIDHCLLGYSDCNKSPKDGCEVGTANDSSNCGSCGKVCSVPNAHSPCVGGKCLFGACLPGWEDCDKAPGNGCEANLASDLRNCGACGVACDLGRFDVCVDGACTKRPGQAAFTKPGLYLWTAPAAVTAVSVVLVGGGGGGACWLGHGGGGAALAFGNNVPVTPGKAYAVKVGAGGDGGWRENTQTVGGPGNNEVVPGGVSQPGEASYFIDFGTLHAEGGGAWYGYNKHATPGGTALSGGGNGGLGHATAGGFTGNGGGGVGIFGGAAGGGGGVGIPRTGACGAGAGGYTAPGGDAIANAGMDAGGAGGSGGSDGECCPVNGNVGRIYGGFGGGFGGGGGSGSTDGCGTGARSLTSGGAGGGGAVRILWGPNRAFPNSNTGDL